MATAIKTSEPKSISYESIVKAQGGNAVNRQTGAVTTAPGYKSSGSRKNSVGEYELDTPTPTISPMPEAQATPLSSPATQPATFPGTPSPKEALASAQSSGIEAPQDGGAARSLMQQFMPPAGNTFYQPSPNSSQIYNEQGQALSYDQYKAQGGQGIAGQGAFPDVRPGLPNTAGIENQLAQDPAYQQLLDDQKLFNNVVTQRQSLTQEYDALTKKLGIKSLNTELMNMKNVIEGTEDDIRNETTKAGGFATESQVQALTMARNKQLVKNYNNLLETKQQAMETLNTMIGLAAQDRAFAMQAIGQKLQIDQQIIEYKDKMRTNAQNMYQKIIDSVGYGGLAQMTGGDPWYTALVEKTMGLQPGGLQQLSGIKTLQERQLEMQQAQYDRSYNLDLANFGLNQAKFDWETSPENPNNIPKLNTQVVDLGNNKKVLINSDTGETIRELGPGETISTPQEQALTKGNIDLINGLLSKKDFANAVAPSSIGRWNIANPFTGAKSNVIASVEQITSQLTLDSLIRAKAQGATFGALSEGELRTLAASATKIGSWAVKDKNGKVTGYNTTEKEFRAELDKINNFAKQDYILKGGNPSDVNAQVMTDGAVYTPAVGGGMTKLMDKIPQAVTTPYQYPANFIGPVPLNQVKGTQQLISPMQSISFNATPLQKLNLSFAPPVPNVNVRIGAGAAVKNNNPGNLRNTDGSWMRFSTPLEGFKGLMGYLERAKAGNHKAYAGNPTLYQFFAKYAPSSDNNNPKGYAEAVARALGVSPGTPISQLDTFAWAKAIARHESNTTIG